MQNVKKKVDFTSGKIFFKMIWFVLPIIATNLLQTAYNAADMMIVSLSGEENAVGAVGVTSSFIHLIINLFIGFSVGSNVVVARHIGAKNKEGVEKAVHTSLLMSLLFGFIGMGLGMAITRPVLSAMGNYGALLELACRYTYICFAGVPFLSLTNYLMAILRAKGDSKTPFIVLALAGLLNVGLNLFFVLALGMSVEGVALATAVANLVSAIVLITKLRLDNDETKCSFKKLKMDMRAFKEIIFVGLPAGIQGALFSLSNILIQSSIVSVNNAVVPQGATYQPVVNGSAATSNIEDFVYSVMNAVANGAITLVSQNIGADKPKRVYRIMYGCFGISVIVWGIMTGLIWALFPQLLGLYGVVDGAQGSLEQSAYETAWSRFLYICVPYFLCGIMEVCSSVLRGLGRSVTSTVISLIGACLFRVVWIWLVFSRYPTLGTVFISYPISWVLVITASFGTILYVLSKLIKQKKMREVITQ